MSQPELQIDNTWLGRETNIGDLVSTLDSRSAGWLSATGHDSDIIISTRIRLARNLAGFTFTKKANEVQLRSTQEKVMGKVKLKLYKGGLRVVGRSSPTSLYDLGLATYGQETTFDQTSSKGFIELWGLPTRAANIVRGKNCPQREQ